MAKGKKYSDEIKEQAYLMYATCGNYNEVSRQTGVPVTTIKGWVDKKPPDELDGLRRKKKEEFIDKASDIIDIGLERLRQDLLDKEKQIPVNHLTTVIGTMYDKRALAKGESTGNTQITFKIPEGMKDFAE